MFAFWGFTAAVPALAQATPPEALPLTIPESAQIRSELEALLDTVQTEIEAIPDDPTPEEAERLTSLNGLLQLLLLQTRLERLQRENTTLTTQASNTASEVPDGAEAELVARRLDAIVQEQREIAEEIATLSTDHSSLLESAVSDSEPSRTHVVSPGDSLSRLAQTYLGDPDRWPELLAANPELSDADRLLVGTELVIPAGD